MQAQRLRGRNLSFLAVVCGNERIRPVAQRERRTDELAPGRLPQSVRDDMNSVAKGKASK